MVDVGGTPLVFRTYLFERNGLLLHVFYLIWEEGNEILICMLSVSIGPV